MARNKNPEPEPDYYSASEPDEGYVQKSAKQIWSHDDTGHLLTVEESLFCRSYIVDRNPVAAMRRLNYAGETEVLRRRAERMLSNPEVQGCIDHLAKRMMERLEITAERVQRSIAAIAFFDPREVFTLEDGSVGVKDLRFWTEDQALNIKGIKKTQFGVEVQLHDRLRAAEILAKQIGVQPEDNAATALAAMKAGADMVMDKVMKVFDRTIPDDPVLPPPRDI